MSQLQGFFSIVTEKFHDNHIAINRKIKDRQNYLPVSFLLITDWKGFRALLIIFMRFLLFCYDTQSDNLRDSSIFGTYKSLARAFGRAEARSFERMRNGGRKRNRTDHHRSYRRSAQTFLKKKLERGLGRLNEFAKNILLILSAKIRLIRPIRVQIFQILLK